MGVDFLDVSFELEKQFGVRLEVDDLLETWQANDNDCTAGMLHEVMCEKCRACGVAVPRSSWNRIRVALVRSLGVAPDEVRKDAWLRRELDFD